MTSAACRRALANERSAAPLPRRGSARVFPYKTGGCRSEGLIASKRRCIAIRRLTVRSVFWDFESCNELCDF